jgi:hypothetical protein
VALRGVEGGEVEPGGQRQGVEFDPVLEGLARQPQRSRPQHNEAMSKSAAQDCQAGAVRMIGEYHEHRRWSFAAAFGRSDATRRDARIDASVTRTSVRRLRGVA